MSKKTRRHLSTEKKAELIRKHLVDKKPISEICDENDLQPSVFYGWLRQLMANAEVALANGKPRKADDGAEQALKAKIERLEAKLAKKDEVIAEISEEFVKVKKTLGEP
jgi:transposase-like protein